MAPIISWWQARSLREQRLLAVLGALLLILALTLLIIRPLARYVESAAPRLDSATQLRSAALAARTGEGQKAQSAQSMLSLEDRIRTTAGEAGFDLAQMVASGGGFTVTLASARAPALFGWITALEERGVMIETAKLEPRSDATLAVTLELKGAR